MRRGPGTYSRLVAVLKVALPMIAAGMLAGLFLIPSDERLGGEILFSEGDMAALGEGLRITDAIFTGSTRGEDTFEFEAALVVPDAVPPTRAEITRLVGHVDLAEGRAINVTAASAALSIPDQRMTLQGSVRIETSDGYTLVTETLLMDLRAGTVEAPGPVESSGPAGMLRAGSLGVTPVADLAGGGAERLFSFGSGVRLRYDPPARRASD